MNFSKSESFDVSDSFVISESDGFPVHPAVNQSINLSERCQELPGYQLRRNSDNK